WLRLNELVVRMVMVGISGGEDGDGDSGGGFGG
nr:hypothetical protein [Tanacetum cinerariifolium]